MTSARDHRNRLTTALTCAAMAEVLLATALLVWWTGQLAADQAVLGRAAATPMIASAMVVLLGAMVAALRGARLARGPRSGVVLLLAVVFAAVGVVALIQLQSAPGIGFVLLAAWLLVVPLGIQIRRSGS
ncbi:hypothetical protein ABZ816_04465 [Actinosynnema sp. NPDC047251]|uniref:Putative secreted protein n=1 Tax=Saccharothrix espanaensis (strain ATCC 51144 / DSM 44229 / JCM 9112 / NBRC 15066 / NRRL 15764) TaxID=1179773 RepID=K0K4R6_SACES|nr:hypothetical protein [Saccharothrix espanaensis]CCH31518.1 putative secreted protein [Saccharothrix espanaensis DSM 44229]